MKKRNAISNEYKWDLTQLCQNDEDFYEKCKTIEKSMGKFEKYKGKLNNKKIIWNYLKESEAFDNLLNEVALYAHCRNDEDLSNETSNKLVAKFSLLYEKICELFAFVSIELHKLSDELLDDIILDKKFKDYDKMFKDIKKHKKHQLDDEVEKFISSMNFLDGYSENMEKFTDVNLKFDDIKDSKGKSHKLDSSLYGVYIANKDRELRKNAIIETHKKYGENIDFLASNYISSVKQDCFFAKQRKYSSAFEASMENEGVNYAVYKSLIKAVRNNLPLLFKYFDKKQKLLGLKNFYNYDASAPISQKFDKKYSFEQAIDIIKKALAPLGVEYGDLIDKAVKEKWIDVFPNEGKRSGAYSTCIFGKNPYVLTNYTDRYEDMSTLAHELGHAMHSYFSNKNQPEPKASYEIFVAEIASTTNEMLLVSYMLENAKTKQEKQEFANLVFSNAKSTIFRQAMFAEFEEKIHNMQEQEIPLTKSDLNNVYYDLNKIYYGKKVKLVKEIQYEWARIPHFFTPFYVYKYAVGLLCAYNFTRRILNKENGAVEDYLKFLSSGGKDTPIQILKEAHCDVEDPNTFEKGFGYLKNMFQYL